VNEEGKKERRKEEREKEKRKKERKKEPTLNISESMSVAWEETQDRRNPKMAARGRKQKATLL
jgi:hypothetical protein